MSEDCLTLNVWTPVEREAAAPIMVFGLLLMGVGEIS